MTVHVPAIVGIVRRFTFLLLSVTFICWFVWPQLQTVFGGFVVGVIASLVNAYHLSWKVGRIGENAALQNKKKTTLGFLTRAAIGLLAVVLATRWFHYNLEATVAGLCVAPIVSLTVGWVLNRKSA